MANIQSIASVGESLVRFLNHHFSEHPPLPHATTNAVLARTEDFDRTSSSDIVPPALSIFLYRIEVNKTMRAAWSGVASQTGEAHLPLDLHFLLTPWADNANFEYRIAGATLACLEQTPILSGPLLDTVGEFAPHEAIQVGLESLSTEDIMRTYDSLPVDYKLSLPYVVRILRMDSLEAIPPVPVTTSVAGVRPEATHE